MTPAELAQHKTAPKRLASAPSFTKLKRGKLPKPFNKMGGDRFHSSGALPVSDIHRIFAFWRDGETLTDRAFFAWLMCELGNGDLYPLFEFHYHPSHKGVHGKLPCNTELNYANRQLPQAPELRLNCQGETDPATVEGRLHLMDRFCRACGIAQGEGGGLWS